ncbi:MAG: VOC family protein [Firmicutes bacterium]|nr:VOC family protein [Bacillota bacterium]
MIHHVALYVSDIEKMKNFYVKYFNGTSNEIYHNPQNEFYSYFITFEDGAKLELMQNGAVTRSHNEVEQAYLGLVHLAFSVGSAEKVNTLTQQLVKDGYIKGGGPRTTGDGYYESLIFDPELNRVEITI